MLKSRSTTGSLSAASPEGLWVRRTQVGFLLVLGATAVQVVWWLVDQSRLADRIADDRAVVLELHREAAEAALRAGQPAEELREFYPELEIEADGARIPQVSLEAIELERRSHLSQYRWEGAFFLFVLGGGILVLWRVLQREADLLARQQNFLAAVSHELRSPLASLRLTTETLLLRDLAALDRRDLLERNLEDLRRLERLVGNLLETTRLEERQAERVREAVDLSEAVSLACAELGHRGEGAARIDVDVQVEPGLGLHADPVGLGTVLRNLIGNAVDSAEAGGSRVVVSARRLESAIELEVADDGMGFEPAEAGRLFEKFYRPGNELRRDKKGSGLGLYLVRGLVSLEGGRVEAASEGPGRGATFRVIWPAAEATAGAAR